MRSHRDGRKPTSPNNHGLAPDSRLQVRLLGPLEVTVGARTVELTTGRLRTLIVALALSAGRPVTVDQLTKTVWGQNLPVDVRRTLSTYMTRLRTALGAESVVFDPTGYVLRVSPDDVDALRFNHLLDAAARAVDPAREAELTDQAVALWREFPFQGVQSAWLEDTEAPRMVERYLSAVERRADRLISAGHGADQGDLGADGDIGALLAGDPFGLSAGTLRGGVLGVEQQQPHGVGGRLVGGRIRCEEGQLLGGGAHRVAPFSSRKTSPRASRSSWSRPRVSRTKPSSSPVSGVPTAVRFSRICSGRVNPTRTAA